MNTPATDPAAIRNAALEEAAQRLDLLAGEFMNPGKTFHYCAEEIRKLKTVPATEGTEQT